jgi:hypothetical protein
MSTYTTVMKLANNLMILLQSFPLLWVPAPLFPEKKAWLSPIIITSEWLDCLFHIQKASGSYLGRYKLHNHNKLILTLMSVLFYCQGIVMYMAPTYHVVCTLLLSSLKLRNILIDGFNRLFSKWSLISLHILKTNFSNKCWQKEVFIYTVKPLFIVFVRGLKKSQWIRENNRCRSHSWNRIRSGTIEIERWIQENEFSGNDRSRFHCIWFS